MNRENTAFFDWLIQSRGKPNKARNNYLIPIAEEYLIMIHTQQDKKTIRQKDNMTKIENRATYH